MKTKSLILFLSIFSSQKLIAQDKVENLITVFTDWRNDTTTCKMERTAYFKYFHHLQNEYENEYFLNLSRNEIEKNLGKPDEKKLRSFSYIIRENSIFNFEAYCEVIFLFTLGKVAGIRLRLVCG